MRVYILSDKKINSGWECNIHLIFISLELAEKIKAGFPYLGLTITEF